MFCCLSVVCFQYLPTKHMHCFSVVCCFCAKNKKRQTNKHAPRGQHFVPTGGAQKFQPRGACSAFQRCWANKQTRTPHLLKQKQPKKTALVKHRALAKRKLYKLYIHNIVHTSLLGLPGGCLRGQCAPAPPEAA